MPQTLQFSIRRLLASTSVICLATAMFAASKFTSDDGNPFLLIASTIVLSSGFGILVRRPVLFALVPTIIWAAFLAFVVFMFWGVEM